MLYRRQKIVLKLLETLPYHPTKTELTKLVFLLRNETVIRSHDSFYSFLPYHYGPFSFILSRELELLKEEGFLQAKDSKIKITHPEKQKNAASVLSIKEIESVRMIAGKYCGIRGNNLLKLVYEKYPWYATRSKAFPTDRTSVPDDKVIFTIGYEGKSIDLFLDILLGKGVVKLIDVRSNTISRKIGFSKNELQNYCDKVGIQYLSFPSLGIPSKLRRQLNSKADYQKIFIKYKKDWLPEVRETVDQVKDEVTTAPSVLMCFENDPAMCHRSIVANTCSQQTGRPIIHI